jgi:hypothetical protein
MHDLLSISTLCSRIRCVVKPIIEKKGTFRYNIISTRGGREGRRGGEGEGKGGEGKRREEREGGEGRGEEESREVRETYNYN